MFGKDKDKIKRQELMRLAIEAKTPEEKERIRAERMAHSKQTSESIDLEYVAASLKAAGSALTPLGAITGWGQGDLKRLNAEKRQKEQMDALLADRASGTPASAVRQPRSSTGARLPKKSFKNRKRSCSEPKLRIKVKKDLTRRQAALCR